MTTSNPLYGSLRNTVSFAITSLASDAALLAGFASAPIDNTALLGYDLQIFFQTMTGATPTAGRQIEVWAFGSDGTIHSGGFSGTAGAATPDEKGAGVLLDYIATDATANKAYRRGPYSLAGKFGLFVPPKVIIFCTHNTGIALHGTAGNHVLSYNTVKASSA